MNNNSFYKILKDICNEENINLEFLSQGFIIQLTKNGIVRHIVDNSFDLNPHASASIACDKFGTYEVLKSKNIPVIEHMLILNPVTRYNYINDNGYFKDIIDYFYKNNNKLVIKPNNGFQGIDVYLCNSLKEVEYAILTLFKKHNSISVCPFYDIKKEYRTFYLNGECFLTYGKEKPFIMGDNGEKIYTSWKHNLSCGATCKLLENGTFKNEIINLTQKTAKAMNLNYAAIDIIDTDSGIFVLEVNASACMTHFLEQIPECYNLCKEFYRKAILLMMHS